MKKNRVYLGVMISVILAVIFYVSYRMLNIEKEELYYTVSVIVDNSSSDRWNAFREGLDQGAEENRIYLNVVSTTEFAGLEEEISIIRRELENGADGVIVELCDSEDPEGLFEDVVSENPVVLVENDMNLYHLYSVVMPDHYSLGEAVAEAVMEGENGSLEGLKIGVLGGNQKKSSLKRCLTGFRETIAESGARISWEIMEEGSDISGILEEYVKKDPVDILVALDNDETELAVDFLLENPDISCRIYGEGRSEKVVYYLDKGLIRTLVVPNEYYMGYQSMVLMSKKLENQIIPSDETLVDFLSVTKDQMYDDDIVQILFPMIR